MLSAKKYPFYFQVFPLLIFLFVSACGTLPHPTGGTTPVNRKDIIKPLFLIIVPSNDPMSEVCAKQLYCRLAYDGVNWYYRKCQEAR